MIKEALAFKIKYSDKFEAAVENARLNKLGLWNEFITINEAKADEYIGSFVKTEFTIYSVEARSNITFINSSDDYTKDFHGFNFKVQQSWRFNHLFCEWSVAE